MNSYLDGGTVFIGHASDDRHVPVVAESAEDCIVDMVERFNLEGRALKLENWDDTAGRLADYESYRFKTKANWWNYASVHEVPLE